MFCCIQVSCRLCAKLTFCRSGEPRTDRNRFQILLQASQFSDRRFGWEIILQPSFITKFSCRPFFRIEFYKYVCCYGSRTAVSTARVARKLSQSLFVAPIELLRDLRNSLRVEQLCSLWYTSLAPQIVKKT